MKRRRPGIKRLKRIEGLRRQQASARFHPALERHLSRFMAFVGCSRSYAIAAHVAKACGEKRF